MFNKTSAFGRNDSVTRRDAPPASPQTTSSPLDKGVTVVRSAVENSPTAAASRPPEAAVTPPSASANGSATALANDTVMGARLIVGPDVKLKGAEILDCDTLVVEGRVEATMDSRVIRIAEKGSFAGKVSIDIAEIHGRFEGELTARCQLIIHSTGRVNGTIRYGKLVIDEGGELCVEINVLSDKLVAPTKPVVEPFLALSVAAG